ncbi:hypothetical protein BKA61DRAFT_570460 [Leptodontidium sp. MPI-SDFR-AT-0119]|nr:hypothetical protein BKA61DRAFT_570460 [Leptodontidium sp. MPI-SDFR-AT-0119]
MTADLKKTREAQWPADCHYLSSLLVVIAVYFSIYIPSPPVPRISWKFVKSCFHNGCLPENISMSIRRSVIGSLRSVSPFSNHNSNNNDQASSVPRSAPTLGNVESFASQNARQPTTGFFKRSAATSPTPEGPLSRMSSFKLARSQEEPFPKFAEFERDIDLVATAQGRAPDGPDEIFEQLLPIESTTDDNTHPLFQLPASVRRQIYGFCFPQELRKVTLSPDFATKAVFHEEYFASPWDIIEPVVGALQSFSMLRNELMTYFWTEYCFHVTLSEFSGPKFSPLSHIWLPQYLRIVQRITVEVDFTKFGCSQMKDAKKFGYNLSKTRQLLNAIVCGLSGRPAKSSVAELHLMCRRYAGFRPLHDTWVESTNDRYCPNDVLNLCDSLVHLRGILYRCRISGFPEAYTQELLNSIFRYGIIAPNYTIPEDDAWPSARPPTLLLSEPPSSEPPTPASLVSMEFGQLKLQHCRSFVEEMEDEMSWYSTSPKSSNYALSPRLDTPTGATPDDGNKTPLAEHVEAYQALLPEMVLSEPSTVDVPSTPEPPLISAIDFVAPANTGPVQTSTTVATLLPRTPAPKSRIPRAFTEPSPRTPNKMNEQNERDPAFIRTVNAMRSLDGANARRHTMIASPKTPKSAGSVGTGKSTPMTKRKYMSFVNRLRGCVDG